jgi:hypothetical protein
MAMFDAEDGQKIEGRKDFLVVGAIEPLINAQKPLIEGSQVRRLNK